MATHAASCSCGQLVLETDEPPVRVSICHCLACQRRTGSVFSAQARFRRCAVRIAGIASAYTRISDDGGSTCFHFCPHCGATVSFESEGDAEHLAVPVGAFADPTFPAPSISVYEDRMHYWVGLPAAIEHLA